MLSARCGKVNRNGPRALVVFPGSLGDLLCMLPTLKVIGRLMPGGVEFIGRGELFEIVGQLSFVHRTLPIDAGFVTRLFFSTSTQKQEIASLFPVATAVFSWFGNAYPEVRDNLNLVAPGAVYSFDFFTGQENCHASAYYLHCIGIQEMRCPSLALGKKEKQWLDSYWEIHEWQPSSKILIVHPGSGGRRKRWEVDGFSQVASRWQRLHKGQVLILLGPAEDQEEGQWRQIGSVEKNLSLLQVAALLSRAGLYLGNDSGVSHLAGAVGARGVVLFGPTRPQHWKPLGGSLLVIRNAAYRANLPYVSGISLLEISAEEVFAALVRQGD